MATDIAKTPQYKHTIRRLEEIRRRSPSGQDFWLAREIAPILGYMVWDKFVPVVERARDAIANNGENPSHHIAPTSKLMGVGKGARRRGDEFFLSRAACYLIAMNGDPAKPAVAGAQAYFLIQTRASELRAQAFKDEKRINLRGKVTLANKRIGDIAKDVGVTRYGLFHDAKYRGIYNMSAKELARHKGLLDGETILDRAAALELSAHEFQANLAAEKILNEGISGEANAIRANRTVAEHVRSVVIQQAGRAPEDLAIEPDHIKDAQRRVNQLKMLPKD
ncbi:MULTISPECIES: BRO family protein [unclassified Sphingobium]|uniref:BRO family protein n=1 Tax=unclassified Sphingobium TaxID=2611147 RepID=UPI0022242C1C|nr:MULTISPECIES: BRO family protein [unclassified Sphingobium]MCW2395299.1 DNA-damage-inducible protein D [Sphingobium sp. B8D3B]MCW2418813.1 DNA-damage-inducible protein D [Sphingobium sp. B8D3C]